MQEAEIETIPKQGSHLGLNNAGNIVAKNRKYRRTRANRAQLEGRSKNYYTTKQTHKRNRHGKIKVVQNHSK